MLNDHFWRPTASSPSTRGIYFNLEHWFFKYQNLIIDLDSIMMLSMLFWSAGSSVYNFAKSCPTWCRRLQSETMRQFPLRLTVGFWIVWLFSSTWLELVWTTTHCCDNSHITWHFKLRLCKFLLFCSLVIYTHNHTNCRGLVIIFTKDVPIIAKSTHPR